ncbi:YgjV family protein [Reinekea blandensis]|uniref:N-acetyltransferase domain-containing protein n=1 Tax=Reinekea blandensis MED297 TaxID=314283 RepID=A4B9P1_9GAMM|nr:YgjV family protein [Reinekea blandensis]EAR11342.1 hypothetical protein MED297_20682 [Reinekea sp. MED297] [Reinekea blandensis MED297]
MSPLELFGYLGSVLIAISLMMSNIKRLRWINLAGAAVFSAYGFLIGALPVFLLNGWIVVVDIYYLVRMYQFRDDFDMVRLSSVHTPLFQLLMKRYGDDMNIYFPKATIEAMENATAMLIFRNMKPVGLFVYQSVQGQPGTIEVLVDYVIPQERDFKTAQYLFTHHTSELRRLDIKTIISKSERPQHIDYLKRMGFTQQDDRMVLDLREGS